MTHLLYGCIVGQIQVCQLTKRLPIEREALSRRRRVAASDWLLQKYIQMSVAGHLLWLQMGLM